MNKQKYSAVVIKRKNGVSSYPKTINTQEVVYQERVVGGKVHYVTELSDNQMRNNIMI